MPAALTVAGPTLLIDKLATGFTVVDTSEKLLLLSGSLTPAAGLIVARLVITPVAEPETCAVIVMTSAPPDGKVGILPLTVLPEMDSVAGHTAPPVALPQTAEPGVKLALRTSLKPVLFAALGPTLLI